MKKTLDIRKAFGEGIGGATFGEGTKENLFGRIKRLKAAFIADNPDTMALDFGIGEPFKGPHEITREATVVGTRNEEFDGYPDLGLPMLREIFSKHLKNVFQVPGIDPETQIQDGWGIKHIISCLAMVFCAPGNKGWPTERYKVAVTAPGYSTFADQAEKLGAEVIPLPVNKANNFIPDISQLDGIKNLKTIYLISPQNPTGRAYDQTLNWWLEVVAWCYKNNVALIVDEAYALLRWVDEEIPFTALSIPGFTDVGVVMQSVSKTFNWTSGRVGLVAGNETIIKAYRKEYEDCSSGQTKANQYGAAISFNNALKILGEVRGAYSYRLGTLVNLLQAKGFDACIPDGGFFILCSAPKSIGKIIFRNAEDFMEYLLNEHGVVSIPFGDQIRFSSTIKVGKPGQPESFDHALKELDRRMPNNLAF